MTFGKSWEAAVNARGLEYAQGEGYEWRRTEPPTVQMGLKLRHMRTDGTVDYELRTPNGDFVPEVKEQGNHYGNIGLSRFVKREQAEFMDQALIDDKTALVLYRWTTERGNRVYLLDWRELRPRVWEYIYATEVRQDLMRAYKLGINGISKPDNLENGVSSIALDEVQDMARGEWRDTGETCPDWLSVYETTIPGRER